MYVKYILYIFIIFLFSPCYLSLVLRLCYRGPIGTIIAAFPWYLSRMSIIFCKLACYETIIAASISQIVSIAFFGVCIPWNLTSLGMFVSNFNLTWFQNTIFPNFLNIVQILLSSCSWALTWIFYEIFCCIKWSVLFTI